MREAGGVTPGKRLARALALAMALGAAAPHAGTEGPNPAPRFQDAPSAPTNSLAAGEGKDQKAQHVQRHGRALVEAINASDPARRRSFLEEAFVEKALTPEFLAALEGAIARLHENMGEIELHHTETSGSAAHVFLRAARGVTWRDLQIRIEEESPWRFVNLIFLAEVTEPVYLPPGAIDYSGTLSWVQDYIDRLVREYDLAGSVLIVKQGRTLLAREFGFADAGRSRSVTASTRFNLGSGTKMLTALAIAQLVEAGRLSYDDPLIKHVPEFPDAAFARKATLRHLLTHTSGLGDYWTDEYEKAWHRVKRLEDSLSFALAGKPSFQPGEGHQYSNTGFLLLGVVVERVSGEDYFEYLDRHIYRPAGMTSSGSSLRDGSVRDLAQALVRDGEGWRAADLGLRGTSAGGSDSTGADVLRFSKALHAGRLLGREALTELLQPKVTDPESRMQYGYGLFFWKDGGSLSYGHPGQARGVNFEYRHFPGDGVDLIIFCNQDNGAFDDLKKNLVRLVSGAR